MKILGFYHVCMINNWESIVAEQVKLIIASGLYLKTDEIMVGCLGPISCKEKLQQILPNKFTVVFHNEDTNLYEIPTLQHLHNVSQTDNFLAWYIHTKGVFSGNIRKDYTNVIRGWRKMMEYFVIEKHTTCINKIQSEDCDACGTEARYCGFPVPIKGEPLYFTDYTPPTHHFSGNFWWSKSSYIKKLPNLYNKWLEVNKSRYIAEAFIGMTANPRFYSFFNNLIDLYENPINEKVYKKFDRLKLFKGKKIKSIKML